jgi:predicted GH43/DUF377 family glycosyl hydrolase
MTSYSKLNAFIFTLYLACSFLPLDALDSKEELSLDPSIEIVNLEDRVQDFVLETKQIIIPGVNRVWNASIARWKGKFLLACRINLYGIGLVWLDDEFNPITPLQKLEIPNQIPNVFSREMDPRIIVIDKHLFLVYSNTRIRENGGQGIRMFVTQIHFDDNAFTADPAECLDFFETNRDHPREKNWVPFAYDGKLLLAYSLKPHRIFQPIGNGKCETLASTLGDINWKWGYLRGGTPAVLDGDHYLAIFHSSSKMRSIQAEGEAARHYLMGAYTFSSEPPFEIKSISPEPIIGKDFYQPYKKASMRVVFPCGLLVSKKFAWITYGKHDHELWVVKLDKKGLLETLVPVRRTN